MDFVGIRRRFVIFQQAETVSCPVFSMVALMLRKERFVRFASALRVKKSVMKFPSVFESKFVRRLRTNSWIWTRFARSSGFGTCR